MQVGGQPLWIKKEFHVTILDLDTTNGLKAVLGADEIRDRVAHHDWSISRKGDGSILSKRKILDGQNTPCLSVIEHIGLPAANALRDELGRATGTLLPPIPPHVTLYTGGDPAGIGLPSYEALREATAATLRLPGLDPRVDPGLPREQRDAYCTADYALGTPGTFVCIGEHSPVIDAALSHHNVDRAIVISAYNPFSEPSDLAGNELRHQWLRAWLEDAGFDFEDAEGRDPTGKWAAEPGFLAFGTTPQIEDRLMQDFEQHGVVVLERGRQARLKLHPDHGPDSNLGAD